VASTRCAEVLSLAPASGLPSKSGDLSDVGTGRPLLQVKILLIAERTDGFFLERFTDRGELVDSAQYETLDEATHEAYSEYTISDWRFCPDDADPLEYIRSRADV
jgi:hypothetical protein